MSKTFVFDWRARLSSLYRRKMHHGCWSMPCSPKLQPPGWYSSRLHVPSAFFSSRLQRRLPEAPRATEWFKLTGLWERDPAEIRWGGMNDRTVGAVFSQTTFTAVRPVLVCTHGIRDDATRFTHYGAYQQINGSGIVSWWTNITRQSWTSTAFAGI